MLKLGRECQHYFSKEGTERDRDTERDRQIDKDRETRDKDRSRETEAERETDSDRDRLTDQREREGDRHRDSQTVTERQTDRERERQRQRDRTAVPGGDLPFTNPTHHQFTYRSSTQRQENCIDGSCNGCDKRVLQHGHVATVHVTHHYGPRAQRAEAVVGRQEMGGLWGGFDADQLHVSCGESVGG